MGTETGPEKQRDRCVERFKYRQTYTAGRPDRSTHKQTHGVTQTDMVTWRPRPRYDATRNSSLLGWFDNPSDARAYLFAHCAHMCD
eukprot:5250614-Alexandrium_andersonii.AAC.1